MRQIVRIGLEIAKRWFQLHAVDEAEKELFNRKLPATKFWAFSARCRLAKSLSKLFVVAPLGSRDRTAGPSRAIDLAELRQALSQTRQVRRHDARALCETASRPDMRFIRVKTEEQQAALMQNTSRQLQIDQRNAVANSLRSQVAEFGVIEKRASRTSPTSRVALTKTIRTSRTFRSPLSRS
jgi:transposase